MMTNSKLTCAVMLTSLLITANALAEGDANDNKQALATSPGELVKMLENVSFMPPEDYREKIRLERGKHAFPIGLQQLPQTLDEATDPRADITAEELEAYAGVLTNIALESRNDGEILWGRIQGTKYERKALSWITEKLESFGLTDVHYDPFPSSSVRGPGRAVGKPARGDPR